MSDAIKDYNFAVELYDTATGNQFTDYGENIEDLLHWRVAEEVYLEDTVVVDFYRLTLDGWVKIKRDELQELLKPLVDHAYDKKKNEQGRKPQYRVYFRTPNGQWDWHSSHDTEKEAKEERDRLPIGLTTDIFHVK